MGGRGKGEGEKKKGNAKMILKGGPSWMLALQIFHCVLQYWDLVVDVVILTY